MQSRLLALLLVCTCTFAVAQAPAAGVATPPPATPSASAPAADAAALDLKEIIRKAAENDEANDKMSRAYTYVERVEEHKLDGDGKTKSVEIKTYEIVNLYGEPVSRLIAKDDKPLSEKEAAKEEERVNKVAEKRKNESPEDKKKRLEKEAKEREEERAFDKELGDAYDFTLIGEELVNGRPTWVIAGEPKRGYEPKLKAAKVLPKMHGQVWIDKAELQFVKADIELIDTISWGGIIARVRKGTRVHFDQVRVNDEVWLPQVARAHLDARLLVFKGFNLDVNVTYRDYKKFRSESRVLGVVGEAGESSPTAPPVAAAPPQPASPPQ